MRSDDTDRIVNLLNLYALTVDTQCWDLFNRVFVPDVDADYGPTARWRGLDSLKRDFALFHSPLDGSQHTVTNHQVIVNDDRANALSYITVRLIRNLPQGGESFWESGGWYDDHLIRTTHGWRIATRVWRGNWSRGNPRVAEASPGSRFDPEMKSLRRAAEEGTISYLNALADTA
jgi:hypothetical protein